MFINWKIIKSMILKMIRRKFEICIQNNNKTSKIEIQWI